jgi:hypothetical protein
MTNIAKRLLSMTAVSLMLAPAAAWACACGCGVFEVGPNMLIPMNMGPTLFAEYDFMDQARNWSGTSSAPATANDDKEIKTNFMTVGGRYMVGENWGITAQVPLWNRIFKTDTGSGVATFEHTALGDVRITAAYSGFSDDMSTNVIVGVKLPTGDYSYAGFDRDTEIGTGSTDILLGLSQTGTITRDGDWTWYGQILWDKPLLKTAGYTPGSEFDGALGIAYSGIAIGGGLQITPYVQAIGSSRIKDRGMDADPPNTGYDRIMLSPGIAIATDKWKIYADVEFPVYQYMNGDQLVAHQLFKLAISYNL